MKFNLLSTLILTFLTTITTNAISGPLEDCISSVTTEGSFMAGRIFKGKAFIPNGNQQIHMKKVARTLAKEGLTINSLDKDMGIVVASYQKRAIGGSAPVTTTFSMTFDQEKNGLNASATLSTPGGITTNEANNKKDMCTLLVSE